jgi:hypothetical protein
VLAAVCFLTPTVFMFAPQYFYFGALAVIALLTFLLVTLRSGSVRNSAAVHGTTVHVRTDEV